MSMVYAVANQKGGVGKSTTVVNLGAYLGSRGKRVLCVDIDPQGNTTTGLGIKKKLLHASSYEVKPSSARRLKTSACCRQRTPSPGQSWSCPIWTTG